MQYKITSPEKLRASITLPSSKSISNRALILNALSGSSMEIENLSDCEDTQVIIDAFNSQSNTFDVRGAGTAMRFLTAFLAAMEGEWIIKGSKRMHERPIEPLVDTLTALGAEIEYMEKEGYPPLKIKGKQLEGGEVFVAGNISSQFISALLMIAPHMRNGLTIHLENEVISKPYIALTVKMLEDYGIETKWIDNDISIASQTFTPKPQTIEPDWSAASYWYAFVALKPKAEIELKGLQKASMQGDANLHRLFIDLGVTSRFTEDSLQICHSGKRTNKFFHDFVNEPDLAQTFVVACCLLNIPFLFSGLQSLRIKETDRIEALKTELKKLGFVLLDSEPGMLEWNGERCLPKDKPQIDTYVDHRMAMAFSAAAIPLKSIIMNNPDVVSKSYLHFWDDLKRAGFTIEQNQ